MMVCRLQTMDPGLCLLTRHLAYACFCFMGAEVTNYRQTTKPKVSCIQPFTENACSSYLQLPIQERSHYLHVAISMEIN